jgi:outer membrane protein OmpA-like peptidoglycan-associated protein
VVRSAVAALGELNDLMRARGVRARIDVLGHTDADGSEDENAPLSRRRAEAVYALVPVGRFDALDFDLKALASAEPLTAGDSEDAKRRNRRVSFRVILQERDRQQGSVR